MNYLDIKKDKIRDAFADFRDSEHRLERVALVRGISFVNDSKATNVNSAWFALEETQGPIIWIAGGVDKGNDYAPLEGLVRAKVKAIVVLGADCLKFHRSFAKSVDLIANVHDMAEAVKIAQHLASKGDTVLLSPACASFDMFQDYQERGRQFKNEVRNYS